MPANFDAYYKWLAIPPEEQPANHYRLLGVRLFESDSDVISNAADARMAQVRTFQNGEQSALSQKLLNELATARVCLLNPEKRQAYDQKLKDAASAATSKTSSASQPAPPASRNGPRRCPSLLL